MSPLRVAAILGLLMSSPWAACTLNEDSHDRQWSQQEKDFLLQGLTSSRDSIVLLTNSLNLDQWNYRTDSTQWCIGEVVTHLSLHDALFFREVKTLIALPTPPAPADSLVDEDHYLMGYAQITANNSGSAPWYLDPRDQWCAPRQATSAFLTTRNHYIEFVNSTEANFRSYFSPNGRGRRQYRDLHQLVMISIAHNRRHLRQIINISQAVNFPD